MTEKLTERPGLVPQTFLDFPYADDLDGVHPVSEQPFDQDSAVRSKIVYLRSIQKHRYLPDDR